VWWQQYGRERQKVQLLWKDGRIKLDHYGDPLEDGIKIWLEHTKKKKVNYTKNRAIGVKGRNHNVVTMGGRLKALCKNKATPIAMRGGNKMVPKIKIG
jgi:hypothetical protein